MKYLFYVLFKVASSAEQQGGDERTRLLPTGFTASEGSYVDGDGTQWQWSTTWQAGYLPMAGNSTRRIHVPRDIDYGVSTSLWFTVWSSADSFSSRRRWVKKVQFQKCVTKCLQIFHIHDLFSAWYLYFRLDNRIKFGVTNIRDFEVKQWTLDIKRVVGMNKFWAMERAPPSSRIVKWNVRSLYTLCGFGLDASR